MAKCNITENVFESDDESISDKFKDYIKARLKAAADCIEATNKQLAVEHPEYFE